MGEATAYFESVLEIRCRLGDAQGEARALADLGWMAWRRCEYAAARQLSSESLALAERTGDKRGMAVALNNLGVTALFEGKLDESRSYLEQSRTIRSATADRRGVAFTDTFLGWTECRAGNHSRAKALLAAAMTAHHSVGDQRLYLFALNVRSAPARGQPSGSGVATRRRIHSGDASPGRPVVACARVGSEGVGSARDRRPRWGGIFRQQQPSTPS